MKVRITVPSERWDFFSASSWPTGKGEYVTDSDIDKIIRFCKEQWEYTPESPSFDKFFTGNMDYVHCFKIDTT